jgi:hypothetical protein
LSGIVYFLHKIELYAGIYRVVMLKNCRSVVGCMVSDFDQSVVGVLYGGVMLEYRLEDVMLGSLELVQLYVTEYDEITYSTAAGAGRIDVLEWVRNQDPPCPWDEWTCRYAASYGHLDVLKWLRSQDPPCPWNVSVCSCAALNGHLDLLIWLRSQDPPCPWNEYACKYAAKYGHLDVLKWAL